MRIVSALMGGAMLVLAGCNKESKPVEEAKPVVAEAPAAVAAAPATPQDDVAAAKEIFANRCTPCHGPQGKGDGPASASLTPKPRNFTDAKWQGEVTDEHIEKIVVYGGAAVGKSPAMPANPDLDQREGVVKALRAHVRSLKLNTN